jgi:hypothetical protein
VEQGTIEVVASYPRLVFTYASSRVNITVDGNLTQRSWGSHPFPVAPGIHEVAVWYQGLLWGQSGEGKAVQVQVGPGETTQVIYRAPYISGGAGTITSENVTPVAAVTLADISSEELLRYARELAQMERSMSCVSMARRGLRTTRRAIEHELRTRGVSLAEDG